MFVRRKANKSGTFSVQVIAKRSGRYVVVKSVGSSKDEAKLRELEQAGYHFIATFGGQLLLDFQPVSLSAEEELRQLSGKITDIRHNGPQLILNPIYDGIGFGRIKDEILRHLVIARICLPQSKLATVDYLRRYFKEDVKLHNIYRYMDKLYNTQREVVQRISVEHTRRILDGRVGIVFYDVTTLYFESSKEDILRAPGFSKDGKTAESQIVLGLLVSAGGYPLSYSVFNGKQYEGRTMLPVIDDFVQRFHIEDFIIVADAGLLSRKNIDLIKSAGYKFILGGRIKKESGTVRKWLFSLTKESAVLHETALNGDERLIVSYSAARAAKTLHNREKGIERLRNAYCSGTVKKRNINRLGYNKFLVIEDDVPVRIDEDKIVEDAKWDGLKGYVTNTDFAPDEVIKRYRELWVVERAFRVTKGNLEARPIFHFTEKRIEAHICICFIAYKVYKELERQIVALGINKSVNKVLEIAKTISTVTFNLSNGEKRSQVMLTTDEQRLLKPLLYPSSRT